MFQNISEYALVAQLDRALVSEAKGHSRFMSISRISVPVTMFSDCLLVVFMYLVAFNWSCDTITEISV